MMCLWSSRGQWAERQRAKEIWERLGWGGLSWSRMGYRSCFNVQRIHWQSAHVHCAKIGTSVEWLSFPIEWWNGGKSIRGIWRRATKYAIFWNSMDSKFRKSINGLPQSTIWYFSDCPAGLGSCIDLETTQSPLLSKNFIFLKAFVQLQRGIAMLKRMWRHVNRMAVWNDGEGKFLAALNLTHYWCIILQKDCLAHIVFESLWQSWNEQP